LKEMMNNMGKGRTSKRCKPNKKKDSKAVIKWAFNEELSGTEMCRVNRIMGKRTAHVKGE